MKYLSIFIALWMAAVSFAACGNDDVEDPTFGTNDKEVTRPNWQKPSNLHYSSMTVIIDQQALPADVEPSKDDLLGAFVNDQCRGVIAPVEDIDELYRFYLVVLATTDDVNNADVKVELRYYNDKEKRIYTSRPFSFEYDGRLGSITKSFVPTWKSTN